MHALAKSAHVLPPSLPPSFPHTLTPSLFPCLAHVQSRWPSVVVVRHLELARDEEVGIAAKRSDGKRDICVGHIGAKLKVLVVVLVHDPPVRLSLLESDDGAIGGARDRVVRSLDTVYHNLVSSLSHPVGIGLLLAEALS